MMTGNRFVNALNKLRRSKNISTGAKLGTYKTVSIVRYASATWVTTKKEVVMLPVWNRKVLRKIFGRRIENIRWMGGVNKKPEEIYGEPNIVESVKS